MKSIQKRHCQFELDKNPTPHSMQNPRCCWCVSLTPMLVHWIEASKYDRKFCGVFHSINTIPRITLSDVTLKNCFGRSFTHAAGVEWLMARLNEDVRTCSVMPSTYCPFDRLWHWLFVRWHINHLNIVLLPRYSHLPEYSMQLEIIKLQPIIPGPDFCHGKKAPCFFSVIFLSQF